MDDRNDKQVPLDILFSVDFLEDAALMMYAEAFVLCTDKT